MLNRKQAIDLAERAAWTFVQAAIAVLAVSNVPFGKATIVAAAAAGISAVKSLLKSQI